ncbi:FAD:protein FMN transferase [Myxococcota bacterium]|nr:FAD:protein FMN transferase [Myxococcota bacterium]
MPRNRRADSKMVGAGIAATVVLALAGLAVFRLAGLYDDERGTVSRNGSVYAGIPARVQFVPMPGAETPDVPWRILVDTGVVFNAFDPTSELGRLNATPGTAPVDVSEELGDAVGSSIGVSQMTRGAFDITIRPLKKLWQDAAATGKMPDDAQIDAARENVGWGLVDLKRTDRSSWQITRARPGIELDLGGIVKGWSVDRAIEHLAARKVESAIVQVGGEIGLIGNTAAQKPWRIGIRHPLDPTANWTVLNLTGPAAVSTSGNYEQPVRIGDTDYYHIFDPTTGRPVPTSVLGVTVVVTSGTSMNTRADGLATAFAVMGVDKSLEIAAGMEGVHVLFIVRDPASGKPVERTSPGFEALR